jgi:HEAT repeat protein
MNDDLSGLIQALRTERPGKAYHRLLELGPVALPALMESFAEESDARIRAILVDIVWQVRSPDSLAFLTRALEDNHPLVWKAALDGLVSLGGSAAIGALETARDRLGEGNAPEKQAWIMEALDQMRQGEAG